MKITYSAACSLDGFIAREDGDVSWLDQLDIGSDETDLERFFQSVDGLIMGRKTYEFVFHYGTWPYEDKPTWVCSHNVVEPMKGANLNVVQNVEDVIAQATSKGMQHLWLVGGGRLASSCLAKGMLTHLSIAEMPIALNSGIPLFSDHDLEEIPFEERVVIEKGRFRQIELTIQRDCR